jgi:curved DNA binding protein
MFINDIGALKSVIEACKPDARIYDLCVLGDELVQKGVSTVYNKKKILKGVAYPTSISVNNVVCHFSPLSSDQTTLKNGDVVKIEMGAQIDGYPALVAHTIVLGDKVSGRNADVVLAAYYGLEAALRTAIPGKTNTEVTNIVQKTAESFKCLPVEGMLSHQLIQNGLDAEKSIIINPNEQQKRAHSEFTLGKHEVYVIDILVSTADGKVTSIRLYNQGACFG